MVIDDSVPCATCGQHVPRAAADVTENGFCCAVLVLIEKRAFLDFSPWAGMSGDKLAAVAEAV